MICKHCGNKIKLKSYKDEYPKHIWMVDNGRDLIWDCCLSRRGNDDWHVPIGFSIYYKSLTNRKITTLVKK